MCVELPLKHQGILILLMFGKVSYSSTRVGKVYVTGKFQSYVFSSLPKVLRFSSKTFCLLILVSGSM